MFGYDIRLKGSTYFEVLCPKDLIISPVYVPTFWKARAGSRTVYLSKLEINVGCNLLKPFFLDAEEVKFVGFSNL
jgi:hypothetical protein